eukprot:m.28215 g.28215  ORF g.28215 m.28215 type:complete len:410 (-) comp9025_c0_seq2:180-1409(-)
MGKKHSKSQSELCCDDLPRCGLSNFGNTCYMNSVLQALFFCADFRAQLLRRGSSLEKLLTGAQDFDRIVSLISSLVELFNFIHQGRKHSTTTVKPSKFFASLRSAHAEFAETGIQHDAQEFLSFLVNSVADIERKLDQLPGQKGERLDSASPSGKSKSHAAGDGLVNGGVGDSPSLGESSHKSKKTWVQDLFEVTLTSEIRCLVCESVTSKEELFFELSLDVEPNTSITACMRKLFRMETFDGDSKYFCDTCQCKQEAERRYRIKQAPQVMVLHLKRFRYSESLGDMTKENCRVTYPTTLRLTTMTTKSEPLYQLSAVVIHSGHRHTSGHYFTVVRGADDSWFLCDDEYVERVAEDELAMFFGQTDVQAQHMKDSETSYLLFYERVDETLPDQEQQLSLPLVEASMSEA